MFFFDGLVVVREVYKQTSEAASLRVMMCYYGSSRDSSTRTPPPAVPPKKLSLRLVLGVTPANVVLVVG